MVWGNYYHDVSERDEPQEIIRLLERILGNSYSVSTISQITDVVMEDVESWQQRELQKRYSILYLGGTYLKLRLDDVANEVICVAISVTEDGYREILGFYVGGQKNFSIGNRCCSISTPEAWKAILLGIFDGLSRLEEIMKAVYPKADVQRCLVHKVRNTLNGVRKKDQPAVSECLKPIYKANSRQEAWQKKYPKASYPGKRIWISC